MAVQAIYLDRNRLEPEKLGTWLRFASYTT